MTQTVMIQIVLVTPLVAMTKYLRIATSQRVHFESRPESTIHHGGQEWKGAGHTASSMKLRAMNAGAQLFLLFI